MLKKSCSTCTSRAALVSCKDQPHLDRVFTEQTLFSCAPGGPLRAQLTAVVYQHSPVMRSQLHTLI